MSGQGSVAPGWYPDPAGPGERWWDGTGWSQHARPLAPQTASAPPMAPQYATVNRQRPELAPQTSVYTPWIWIVTLAPFVAVIPLFFIDMQSILMRSVMDPQFGSLALFLDPAYLATTVLGWLAYAAAIVCSWLDRRELMRRGVERPFHWAWSCLSSAIYVIGRSVIVPKIAQGRGRAPMWIVIALMVASFIAAVVWSIWVINLSLQVVMHSPGFAR